MISAAYKALGDLLSPEFRSVLFKALGLTLALFVGLFILTEILVAKLTTLSWPWAETLLAIGTGLAMLAAFFFLMTPVAAMFAGFFLDRVTELVEAKHYPRDRPGVPVPAMQSIFAGIRFGILVLIVNLAVLPLVFTGIGAIVLVVINAYLLSREYFEMIATRHMDAADARQLRKENTPAIFAAGLLPAILSLIPLANLAMPLFATSYFVHIFKQVRASSA